MRHLLIIAALMLLGCPGGEWACAADPLPTLPKSIAYQFDDAFPVITLPPGGYSIDGPLIVKPGTRRISGYGCTLVPRSGFALWLLSPGVKPGVINHDHQLHVTGKIGPGTDSLKLAEPADLKPGEVVLVKIGVRPTDPVEPIRDVWMTVAACDGKTVRFRQSFAEAIPDFGSRKELEKVVTDAYQRSKVGDWGKRISDGRASRGYGTDHGVIRFAGGRPIEGVVVEGLTLRYEPTHRMAGAAGFYAHYARNVTYRDVTVINPRSYAVHSLGCDGLTVDGLTITGEGAGLIYNTENTASVAVSAYGGRGHRYRNLRIDAANLALWSFEVGAAATFEDVDYRTSLTKNPKHLVTPFGSFPGGEPTLVRRGRFDFDGADYLFASGAPVTTFEACEFARPLGGWWEHRAAEIRGGITIAGVRFGETRRETWVRTFDEDGHWDLPAGIYLGGTVTLSTRDGVRDVIAPDEAVRFEGLAGRLPANRWEQLPPGFPAVSGQFRRRVTVYFEKKANPVTVTVDVEYLPEVKA